MKRYALSFLFSAVYVGFLYLVFSSDFSKEYSFLYPQDGFVDVSESKFLEVHSDLESLEVDSQAELVLVSDVGGHSPEGAGH